MLDIILNAEGWTQAFWLALGGLAVSAACFVAQPLLRASRSYLPKTPQTRRDPHSDKTIQNADVPENEPFRLASIEGVGVVIALHLARQGIKTFADVANHSPADLRRVLAAGGASLQLAEPMSWPLQAHFLATGQFKAFHNLATALPAGVPRLEQINGIKDWRGKRLREAGICSLETLGKTDPLTIAEAAEVEFEAAEQWASDARRLYDGDRELLAEVTELGSPDLGRWHVATKGDSVGSGADGGPDEARRDAAGEKPTDDTARVPDGFDDATSADPVMPSPITPCKQCCGALISAAALAIIFVAAAIGRIPPPPPPKPERLCPHLSVPRFHKELLTDQLFDSNTDILKPEARKPLDDLAAVISAKADLDDELPGALVVIGHADRRTSRRLGGNQKLSEDRAEAVSTYLTRRLNVGKRSWPSDIVFTLGKGDRVPHQQTPKICAGTPEEREACYRRDRRVDLYAFYIDRSEAPGASAFAAPAASPSVSATVSPR